MMRRFRLRDDQWERIKDLLPGREGSVGVTAADNRLFIEAVLYRYRTGMPWRDLPERFGDGTKVHLRFSRWAKSGVWERVFRHLAADADNEYAMIDSSYESKKQPRRNRSRITRRRLTAKCGNPDSPHQHRVLVAPTDRNRLIDDRP